MTSIGQRERQGGSVFARWCCSCKQQSLISVIRQMKTQDNMIESGIEIGLMDRRSYEVESMIMRVHGLG